MSLTVKLLARSTVQRALLEDRPVNIWGDDLLAAVQQDLVRCEIWHSARGVRRTFHGHVTAGKHWSPARQALLEVRRAKNLTVDDQLIGPAMISSRNEPPRPSWEGRDTPAVMRQVAEAVIALMAVPR